MWHNMQMILLLGLMQLLENMNKSMVSHVQKLYQSKLNKLTTYMKENSFELSREKTCLIMEKTPKAYLK